MEVHHTQAFEFSAQKCWELLGTDEVQAEITRTARITTEPIENQQTPRGHTRRYRVVPDEKLPPMAARALGAPRFTYVQTDIIDDLDRLVTWSIRPDKMGDRIQASGRISLVDTPQGGCQRKFHSKICVAIPVIGRKIEKLVIDNLSSSHERVAEVLRAWATQDRKRT